MICAPTDSAAQALAHDLKWFWEAWAVPFGQPFPELLFGSPDTLSRRIEEAARAVPINEMFLIFPQGLHAHDAVCASLELFAQKVMPRFA
jgi:alkanesulfonate monooxygenase SsuD/methylene tetrahydromethanopterin reductase-like flavin-dependent oxidoreductase (luciferase family)